MSQENSGSDTSTNTVLLVLVLLILVGFGVWWMSTHKTPAIAPPDNNGGINIEVKVPASETASPSPTTSPNPQ